MTSLILVSINDNNLTEISHILTNNQANESVEILG